MGRFVNLRQCHEKLLWALGLVWHRLRQLDRVHLHLKRALRLQYWLAGFRDLGQWGGHDIRLSRQWDSELNRGDGRGSREDGDADDGRLPVRVENLYGILLFELGRLQHFDILNRGGLQIVLKVVICTLVR